MNYIVAGAGGEMLTQVMGGHITVATGGSTSSPADRDRQATGARHLLAGAPARRRHPDVQGAGLDVELVNWRGLMAPAGSRRRGPRGARRRRIGEMVKSDAWQALLEGARLGRHVPAFGDLRGLPRRGADPRRPNPRRARPRRVVTGAAGLAVGRPLPAYRVATGVLEGSQHASCSRLAPGAATRPPRPRAGVSGPPTAAQEAEASATFGPASAASHLHVRGATDIAALAPVVLAFVETLPGLQSPLKSGTPTSFTRSRPPPAGRAARGRPADELGRRPVGRAGQRRLRLPHRRSRPRRCRPRTTGATSSSA